jgi:hypothetical protein
MGFYLKPGQVQVLGMSGKARSGKDFLAQVAVEEFDFLPMALANHFKISAIAKGLEDLPADQLDIRQMWENDKDGAHRRALQLEGTERGRNVYGEDVWLRHAEAWMYYFALKGFTRFVVNDVRFINEVRWVQSLGGKVYRVVGRGGATSGIAEHPSETQLDGYTGFNRVIDNSLARQHASPNEMRTALYEDFALHMVPAPQLEPIAALEAGDRR